MFQPSDHFCGHPLDLLSEVHAFPVLRAPELDEILQVRSHQSRVEEQNHLPRYAGYTSDAAQNMIGLLRCESKLLALVQFFIHQLPQYASVCFLSSPPLGMYSLLHMHIPMV